MNKQNDAWFFRRWSEKCGGPAQGAPELHVMLADYVWASARDLATASRHYLRGDKPVRFAEVLGEAMQQVRVRSGIVLGI